MLTTQSIYETICRKKDAGKKMFVVLLDPDKCSNTDARTLIRLLNVSTPDFVFVGGSQMKGSAEELISLLKQHLPIPVILFPGHMSQFSSNADALLYLSLISGRNPEFLIGQHVESAFAIRKSQIEVIPTAYILLDGGIQSAVQEVTGTTPIDLNDPDKIVSTALAGELLGMKMVYLEAGSGAKNPVPVEMVSIVRQNIKLPIIVGGGINASGLLPQLFDAGADVVVVGNALENNMKRLPEFVGLTKLYNRNKR